MLIGIIAVLAAGIAAPTDSPAASQSTAASPPAATQAAAKPVENPDDKVICKTVVPLGSRLGGTRECHTKAQWNAASRDAESEFNRNQMTYQNSPSGH